MKTTLLALSLLLTPGLARAQEAPTTFDKAKAAGPTFGHSKMGEAFNEGPRRRAYLMPGMAKIVFPVTTKNKTAQKFIEQGISQLHGYWWLEAERSFRQAAALDSKCAMAYWGMAMASFDDEKSAREFCQLAMERKSGVSGREAAYITALHNYLNADEKLKDRNKTRRKSFHDALAKIATENPNDIEAQAFTLHTALDWQYDLGLKAVDIEKGMQALFAKNPNHPIHHYRIHLWDNNNAEQNGISSAGLNGLSSPGIAHMWHMQGHIYSGLKRYADAAWSQEASARVDHAYMVRDRILPDQIHNYAHNNQWLAEDLIYTGRVSDAIAIAKNLIANPRHPKFNTLVGFGSASNGRTRLIQALRDFDLFTEALRLDRLGFVEPGSTPVMQADRLSLLATAAFLTTDTARGQAFLTELETLAQAQSDKKPDDYTRKVVEGHLAEARMAAALTAGKNSDALAQLEKATQLSPAQKARRYAALGNFESAEKAAREGVSSGENRVAPLATLVGVLADSGKAAEAKVEFEKLRALAVNAELDTPLLARLKPVAEACGSPARWSTGWTAPPEGKGWPALDTLGPLVWTPPAAPDFTLTTPTNQKVTLSDYQKQGKPVVVLFYLGSGCEQCMKQLQGLAPLYAEFEKAGIAVVAVSNESRLILAKTAKTFPFPLLTDDRLSAFKAFQAYDDFEEMPLHGAFLVDGAGKLRWHDIGYQPFKDTAFLLGEAKRLLALPK